MDMKAEKEEEKDGSREKARNIETYVTTRRL